MTAKVIGYEDATATTQPILIVQYTNTGSDNGNTALGSAALTANTSGTNNFSLVTANALQINGSFPPPYGILN